MCTYTYLYIHNIIFQPYQSTAKWEKLDSKQNKLQQVKGKAVGAVPGPNQTELNHPLYNAIYLQYI